MFTTDVSAQWSLTLPGPTPGTPTRSPGLHVSDLVRAAAIDAGLFTPEDEQDGLDAPQFPQHAINRMCAGLAWEEWLERRYSIHHGGALWFHPFEVTRDGVAGSPDAVSRHWDAAMGHPWATIHEFKFTWKSTNAPVHKSWYWLSQIQAYLHMMDWPGRTVYTSFLHTYHVMGDYRGSGPIYRVTRLEFTPYELTENWRTLMQYRPPHS